MFKDLFGRQTIEKLQSDLQVAKSSLAITNRAYKQKESELSILQETFRNGVRITDELKEKVADIETDLADARAANDDLDERGRNFARQADDLAFQVRTLENVLEQLQIPVKLPRPARAKLTK